MEFKLCSTESAPEASKPDLEAAQRAFGSIPNLYRGLATSPATFKVYLAMSELLRELGNFSPVEQQVVYLTVSAENGCQYCVGAHSVLADMAEMPETTLSELRQQRPLSDVRLNALRTFTLSVIEHDGRVPEAELAAFESAGYQPAHVLEVLTILAQKTISNFFNHMAETPLDEMFRAGEWRKKEEGATAP